jgi:hypothetical protein
VSFASLHPCVFHFFLSTAPGFLWHSYHLPLPNAVTLQQFHDTRLLFAAVFFAAVCLFVCLFVFW